MEITKNNYEKEVTQSDIPVLLDFWATWCGPCRMIAGEVEKISKQSDGFVKVGKINVDEEPYLCEKFSIDVIPTLIYLEKGEEKKRFSGYITFDEIVEKFGLKK